MDQNQPVFTLALDRNVFLQYTNWENDDTGPKSIPHHADPYHGHPCDLLVFHQGYFDNTNINACAFSIAVFSVISCLQEKFYPQFNLSDPDNSFNAALKLKLQETHWMKGHKFVQIVIQ